jgi:ATP-dependent Zn protease
MSHNTNIPEVLDPALTRAGRLNRRIPVHKPDREGRREIIKGYLNKVHENLDTFQIEDLTDDAGEMSPAEIRQLVLEEAPRKAHFRGSEVVEAQDFTEALSEVQVGMKNPFKTLTPDERKALAVHEGGHAVLAWVLTDHRLQKVTIIRYGDALGHVAPVEVQERHLRTLREYYHDLVISLGGRAGEILCHEMMASTGGDYPAVMARASYLLSRGMWGTPLGTEKETSIRARALFEVGLEDAIKLLKKYKRLHDDIVDALLTHNELKHDDVVKLFGERPVEKLAFPTEPSALGIMGKGGEDK